ncbi:MAG TPA: NAD(P)/FAD-dependent oxidoreductase [bacterium]|nr:NAD(P)/FAD-dependent oxidoreductase [bacterium]
MDYEAVIIGGGPAAHNAGLALGRARRRILICDEARPRNGIAARSHTFFTRDGVPPLELRRVAVDQLKPYDTVTFAEDRVTEVSALAGGFRLRFDRRESVTAELVLLATGMEDVRPDVPGFDELWGETVIHCPYCHGWEVRDLPWAAYLTVAEPFVNLARLLSWSDDVIVIVAGHVDLPADTQAGLESLGLRVESGTIRALHAENGKLDAIELQDGRRIPRRVLVHAPSQRQTALVRELGLDLDETGYVITDDSKQTNVPGIYAAGDLTTPRQQIAFAAADGLRAAISMHGTLATSV